MSRRVCARISEATKRKLDELASSTGMRKSHLIEEALLFHFRSLRELPPELLVPPKLLVDAATGRRLLQRVRRPRRPTRAMRDLFRGETGGG